MAKIRILQLITTLERAGAQSLLVNLCRTLDPTQFDVTLAFLRGKPEILSGSQEPFRLVDLSDNGRFSPLSFLRVLGLLRTHDLLHTHLVHASIVGLAAARFAHRPASVYTRHHDAVGRRRWDYRIEARLARTAQAIIAVSESIRDDLLATGASAERVEVIPNGIDVSCFADGRGTRKPTSEHRGPCIGTIARLEPQKALDVLLEAFRIVLQKWPGASLEIVGSGRERESLESLTRQLGIEHQVRFLGSLPPEDIPRRLAQWDIFALTSRREPFGIVAAEAMAAGVPVVVSDIGGLRDVVRHETTGLKFPVGSSSQAAEEIARVWQDETLRTRLTAAALTDVRTRFELKVCVERHAQLYRRLQIVE